MKRAACLLVVLCACGGTGIPRREDASLDDAAPTSDGGPDATLADGGDGGSARLVAAPPSLDFGAQAVGTQSAPSALTVMNLGTGASGPLQVSLSGVGGVFALTSDSCSGHSLAAGAGCAVAVRFAPTAGGSVNGDVTIAAAPGGTVTAGLTGLGLAVGILSMAPAAHDFGSVVVGTPSLTSSFMVSNTGVAATGVLSTGLAGSGQSSFVVTSDGCSGQTLAAAGTCAVVVRFLPDAAGARAATLMVSGNPGGAAAAALTGTGLGAASLTMTPGAQGFGTVGVGQSSAPTSFTVMNGGGVASGPLALALTGGAGDQYQLTADGCSGMALAPGASCSFGVSFAPTSAGGKSAGVTVTATPGGSGSAVLTGTGQAAASLAVSPTMQDFGPLGTGAQSSPVTFTVTNSGGVATGNLTAALGGASTADFTLSADTCSGHALAPAGTCTLAVRFSPGGIGSRAAQLALTATPGGNASATLSGTGVAPSALTVTPSPASFGSVIVGGSSATSSFTVHNTGVVPSALTVTLTGSDAADFVVVANGCSAQLAGGGSCTVTVRFAPLTRGQKAAALTVTGTPGGTTSAVVNGIALAQANLTITPPSQQFLTTVTGQVSRLVAFIVSNDGDVATGVLTTRLGGSDAGQFTKVDDDCDAAPLGPGASCVMDLVFSPLTPGDKSATLSVSGSFGNTAMAALAGTALAPASLILTPATSDFGSTVAGGAGPINHFTVMNGGQAASGPLTVATGGGDAGDFIIVASSCTGSALATGASCGLDVRFLPRTAGSKSATLLVSGSPGGSASSALTGMGLTPALLDVSPLANDFGSVVSGQSGAAVMFTVHNGGQVASGILATALGGTGATHFGVTSDACATHALAAGQTCLVGVHFAPQTTGALVASLTVTGNPGGSATANLTGTGLSAASLTLSPSGSHDFGDALVSSNGPPFTFTVTNTGTGTSGVLSVVLGGANPGQFALSKNMCANTVLAAGASCTVDVRFSPGASAGVKTATFTVAAVPGGSVFVNLTGLAQNPAHLVIAPTSHDYLTQVDGTSSADVSFAVTNSGDVVSGSLSTLLAGTDAGQLGLGANTCAGQTLPPRSTGSCTVAVHFAPTTPGAKSARLDVTGAPGGTASASFTGTGLSPAHLMADAPSLGFAPALLGGAHTLSFNVQNTGQVATGSLTVAVANTQSPTSFASSGCAGQTLAPNASCSVTVSFTPALRGALDGSVTVSDGVVSSVTLPLTGTGQAPASLSLSTGTAFPDTLIGSSSAPTAFSLMNSGDVASASLTTTLVPATQFSVTSDGCAGAPLAGGASCTIQVSFAPVGPAGLQSSSLQVGGAQSPLSGLALAGPMLAGSPDPQDFPDTFQGASSSDLTITVSNSGDAASASLVTSLGGDDPGDFGIGADTCNGSPLAAGASCTIDVHFSPLFSSLGARAASLLVGAQVVSHLTGFADM